VPVLEWLIWQVGGFGPMPHQLSHFLTVESEADRPYGIEHYSKETRRLCGVLDKRLGEVKFGGGDISIADLTIIGLAWRHEPHQIDLAHFPNVRRWYATLMPRPVCIAVTRSR
jgi:GSH-dependent disulfide-bond oxidoreductase